MNKKPPRVVWKGQRFTMHEPKPPTYFIDGVETWPRASDEPTGERFTMLELKGPNNPPAGMETWPRTADPADDPPPRSADVAPPSADARPAAAAD